MLSFVGTTELLMDVDPREYHSMSTRQIEGVLLEMLRDIAPNVSFFEADVALSAVELGFASLTEQVKLLMGLE